MGEAERHDSLVASQKAPLRTLRDALLACTAEFQSDRFWADMAKPITKVIEKFDEAEAARAPEAATEARGVGMFCLDHLVQQLQEAQSASLFVHESKLVKLVRDAMAHDETISLETPLDSVAQAVHRMQSDGVGERKHFEAMGQAQLQKMQKALRPYVFEHSPSQPEMTVKIAVPAETKSGHVQVKITREAILVAVAGHELQPAVIEGKLQRAVDPGSCEWHLEGTGEARMLVLDLEKASGGLDWDDLLVR